MSNGFNEARFFPLKGCISPYCQFRSGFRLFPAIRRLVYLSYRCLSPVDLPDRHHSPSTNVGPPPAMDSARTWPMRCTFEREGEIFEFADLIVEGRDSQKPPGRRASQRDFEPGVNGRR